MESARDPLRMMVIVFSMQISDVAIRVLDSMVPVTPGSFIVHPPGEVHEYENGPTRTLLFRVRYGSDMLSRHVSWRNAPKWSQSAEDAEYYRQHR